MLVYTTGNTFRSVKSSNATTELGRLNVQCKRTSMITSNLVSKILTNKINLLHKMTPHHNNLHY